MKTCAGTPLVLMLNILKAEPPSSDASVARQRRHTALCDLAGVEGLSAGTTLGGAFLSTYSSVQRKLGQEEKALRESILEGLDLSSIRRQIEVARQHKKSFYRAMGERDFAHSQVEALSHSGGRVAATQKLLAAQRAELAAERHCVELERTSMDSMLQALGSASNLVMEQLCGAMQRQIVHKQRTLSILESQCHDLERAKRLASEHVAEQTARQVERKEALAAIKASSALPPRSSHHAEL